MQTDGCGPDGRARAPGWLIGRDGARTRLAPTPRWTKPQASGPTPAPDLLRARKSSTPDILGWPRVSWPAAEAPFPRMEV